MLNVADRVKKALFDKGWTVKKLCAEIDVSEQGYKHMVEKDSWKLQNLVKIAEVLELPLTYFITEQADATIEPQRKAVEENHFGNQVAERILEEFQALKSQLSIKDRQIDGLQRTVDALISRQITPAANFLKDVPYEGRIVPLYSISEKATA